LLSTAFENPDGTLVVIVMNQGDKDMDCLVWIDGAAAEANIRGRSINTILVPPAR
jgi:glucosylceramidase